MRLPILLLLTCTACGGSPAGSQDAALFVDGTAHSGLSFTPTLGTWPAQEILDVKGGGLALLDYDADGDLDLFVPGGSTLEQPQAGPGAKLFANDGTGHFTEVADVAGIEHQRWSFGVLAADFDGNGWEDLFIACYGSNALLLNHEGRFLPAEGFPAGEAWSVAATTGDFDGDGDLDLYVVNYLEFDAGNPPPPTEFLGAKVFAGPSGLEAAPDQVLENLGNGSFREATGAWGFDTVAPGYGLGAVALNFDGELGCEVFVGNDSGPNFLFKRGDGLRFTDRGLASGVAYSEEGAGQATMGIALGDVDGNGLPDLFTTNFMADTNTLHMNLGHGLFEDRTRAYGLGLASRPYLGWSTGLYDFDLDGDEDLLIFNGHVYPESVTEPQGWLHRQEPLYFERSGARFTRRSGTEVGAVLDKPYCDRGAAFGDLDGDGDVDTVICGRGAPLRVLETRAPQNPWLRVVLRDRTAESHNSAGIGATLELGQGALVQRRWIATGLSYQSSSDLGATFGFGAAAPSEVVLRILWPDGVEQSARTAELNRTWTVERQP